MQNIKPDTQDEIKNLLSGYVVEVTHSLERLPWESLTRVMQTLHQARLRRSSIFICGNGGSAATASHMVNDLNKGANVSGLPRFRALGLVDNTPLLTAWANDLAYSEAFSEQLKNLARPGDVLVAISGSGNSANVLSAVALARQLGVVTIGWAGRDGGKLAQAVHIPLVVGIQSMEQIEDVHMLVEHCLVNGLREYGLHHLVPSLLMGFGEQFPQDTCAAAGARSAIFLDRDGVINENRSDYVKSWEELVLLPGALEALLGLATLGMPIVVVTNQSAVGRGDASFEVVESINRRLMAWVNSQGGRIDAIAWCPHHPDDCCDCRKPGSGMLTYASQMLGIDLATSYLVGDAESDVQAGRAAGCASALVLTGRGQDHRARVNEHFPDAPILASLGDVAAWVSGSR